MAAEKDVEEQSVTPNWTAELEVALFHSMHGHKPVGLNKHFNMVCIQHKLQQSAGLFLNSDQIWSHLKSLYDLKSLDEFEKFPLPKEKKEFSLPDYFLPLELSHHAQHTEGDNESVGKFSSHLSSSPSPASSPINRPSSKRKKT